MLRSYIATLILILFPFIVFGQGRNATWCFGDSAGIKFTSGGVVGITSVLQSQEACASIADTSGNLIFYAGSIGGNNIFHANLYDNMNLQLINGDSIISTSSATQGLLILPFFNNINKFSLYSIGFIPTVFPHYSLFSTTVDMSMGNGMVTLKNQIIDTAVWYNEKMIAIKHGNGRDWWLINHEQNSDQFIIRLIQNNIIINSYYQHIGSNLASSDGAGQMTINPEGNKLALVGQAGTINVFDFDRCTGLLSNFINMSDSLLPGFDRYYGSSISSQNLLYYSTWDSIWQIDLNVPNPFQSKHLVYADQNGNVCMGQHQLGLDGKIYIANMLFCGGPTNINDSLNTHLTVINMPDVSGIGCNVLPYFQLIGGGRTYLGLPNMPNYELGPMVGSPCDTLTSIHSIHENKKGFEIIPNPVISDFAVSISGIADAENHFELRIFNSKGQLVFKDRKYKVGDKINCTMFSSGLYAITLTKNGQQWFNKFIKL